MDVVPAPKVQFIPIFSEEDRLSAFREVMRGLGELLKPKERLNVWQWADKKRKLAKGTSAKALEGDADYRSADAPHQRKPQESFTDPNTQVTVLVMASQIGGKTEMFNNAIGYHMDQAPRSCVVMYPQLDAAEKYSKKKFTPMVEATPCLAKLVKPSRARDSGNTILVKEFNGGCVFFVGANSPTSVRGVLGAVLIGDEIDAMRPNAEGDPVELLFKRGESFPDVVKILSSTPTLKGASAIWSWFELSNQQYWYVPCVKCGIFQTLKWFQIVWPKGEPEKAELVCSSCAGALSDAQRLEMYYNGDWRSTAPFKGIAGYHLNGINCPWPAQKGYANRLHQMAVEHIRACDKGEYAKQVWVNTFLCECWEVETERVEPTALLERLEDYSPEKLPDEIVIILVNVDVQKDRLELETIGLGLDDETWGIEFKKIFGDTEQDQVWDDLADHLVKIYKREDGVELRITATAIDMRHRGHKVRKFIQRSGIPRVHAVYGAGNASPLLVTSRTNKRYRIRTHAINTKLAKDIIFARLRMTEPGPRFMHYPNGQGYTDDYFQQLTAEVLRRKKDKGVTVEYYEKIRDRNEALDIRVYFLALIDILNPNLTAIAKKLRPKIEQDGTDEPGGQVNKPKEYQLKPPAEEDPSSKIQAPAKQQTPTPVRPRRGGGFVNKWKKT